MDDVLATTQTGAAALSTEDAFQHFYDNGGLEDQPRDAQEGAQTPQDAPQDAQQDAQDGQQQQDETPTYASLSELLTAHKIDPDSVMGLHVTAKIDGKETQVPLSDVLKSYQLEGHVNNKSIELSNQRTAFEQERQAARTMFQQQMQQNQALSNLAMQELTHQFQKVDWNGLRANNPAEFAALNAEFQQRHNQIQNYMQAVNQAAQQEAQRQQDDLQRVLSDERSKLMDAKPEWRDDQKFTQDRNMMSQYARSLGFQDAELSQIYDHRIMRAMHDAARYQALQASGADALKQVRQAPPKVVAPGSRTDVNPNAVKRQQVMDRLSRNPRDQDAQAAAFDYFAQ